ncbi:MAG: hypothetical protein MJA84_07220 [Firmicutes bacterium]|nr:hypothetical protein [Bacillota bacterium]
MPQVMITGNVWDVNGPIKIGTVIRVDDKEAERLIQLEKAEMAPEKTKQPKPKPDKKKTQEDKKDGGPADPGNPPADPAAGQS